MIPKPKDAKSLALEPLGACRIVFRLRCVLASIQFHEQAMR